MPTDKRASAAALSLLRSWGDGFLPAFWFAIRFMTSRTRHMRRTTPCRWSSRNTVTSHFPSNPSKRNCQSPLRCQRIFFRRKNYRSIFPSRHNTCIEPSRFHYTERTFFP